MPYSPSATLPDGDGQALIEYVKSMNLLAEQKDALGRILYLDEQNAVLATYYRNNVLHVFALPALIASFFQSNSRISREQLLRFARALYPYLQAELFIRWSLDELDAVIDQWLAALVEQGLLRQENDTFIRPAPSSRQYVLLILLARSVTQTLQRFYMAIALLLNAGQNALTAEELENLCTVMAQRLSILHGLNAPEFFDKSLFRHFIQTLLDLRAAQGRGRQASYHELLGELAEGAAKRVLPAEIRLSIRQVALERPPRKPPPKATTQPPAETRRPPCGRPAEISCDLSLFRPGNLCWFPGSEARSFLFRLKGGSHENCHCCSPPASSPAAVPSNRLRNASFDGRVFYRERIALPPRRA